MRLSAATDRRVVTANTAGPLIASCSDPSVRSSNRARTLASRSRCRSIAKPPCASSANSRACRPSELIHTPCRRSGKTAGAYRRNAERLAAVGSRSTSAGRSTAVLATSSESRSRSARPRLSAPSASGGSGTSRYRCSINQLRSSASIPRLPFSMRRIRRSRERPSRSRRLAAASPSLEAPETAINRPRAVVPSRSSSISRPATGSSVRGRNWPRSLSTRRPRTRIAIHATRTTAMTRVGAWRRLITGLRGSPSPCVPSGIPAPRCGAVSHGVHGSRRTAAWRPRARLDRRATKRRLEG